MLSIQKTKWQEKKSQQLVRTVMLLQNSLKFSDTQWRTVQRHDIISYPAGIVGAFRLNMPPTWLQ